MAGGTHALQLCPHMAQRVERLVGIGSSDDDALCLLHAVETSNDRQTELMRGLVDQHKQLVVRALCNGI